MALVSVKAHKLTKSYGDTEVFSGISFQVPQGGSLVFLGPSGSGKTTILKILQGLIKDYSGTLSLEPMDAPRSLVLQEHGLFPWKSARENLELPLLFHGISKALRKEKVLSMLKHLGLDGLGDRYPAQLSGGQRQRLALGRSLILGPKLLFLDEPFSSLDAITKEDAERLLLGLWKSLGLSMVISTHSVSEAVLLGDIIHVLGGSPTGILHTFENPWAGASDKNSLERAFSLSLELREALRGGRGD